MQRTSLGFGEDQEAIVYGVPPGRQDAANEHYQEMVRAGERAAARDAALGVEKTRARERIRQWFRWFTGRKPVS